jgi:DsbC/DsbD-like thiol-disulfide interchange protein
MVMLKNRSYAIVCNLRLYVLNESRGRLRAAAIFLRSPIVKLLALVFVLIAALTTSLGAQSDTISLPDDSGAPAADAIRTVPAKDGIDLKVGDVQAVFRVANSGQLRPGGKVDIMVHFAVAPGWHIYGAPLPAGEDLTPTSLSFDHTVAARESVSMPPPAEMRFAALGETLPVYQGNFSASAELQLTPAIKTGPQTLPGTLSFQECNNLLCKMPRQVPFSLPINVTD